MTWLVASLLVGCGAACPVDPPALDPVPTATACVPTEGDLLVLCPTPSDDAPPAPGVGISTFYETNAEVDVRYPDTTIAYQRWYWRELETAVGSTTSRPSTTSWPAPSTQGRTWASASCRRALARSTSPPG